MRVSCELEKPSEQLFYFWVEVVVVVVWFFFSPYVFCLVGFLKLKSVS